MQLTVDVRQSTPPPASAADASYGWIFGVAPADDSEVAMLPAPPYSFLAECECPHDCLRDHENE